MAEVTIECKKDCGVEAAKEHASSWLKVTAIQQLIALYVASKQYSAAKDVAKIQEGIAKGYLDLAKKQYQRWEDLFRDCETQEIKEACEAPLYEPKYDLVAGRFANQVSRGFANARRELMRCATRYCTGLTAMQLKDLALAEATAVGDAMNFAYRYEEARKDSYNDLRWNRRSQALNRGRDLMSQGASYAQMASGLYGQLGQQAAASAAGALQFLGYSLNRQYTPPNSFSQPQQAQPLRYSFNEFSPGPPAQTYGYNDQGGIPTGVPTGADGMALGGITGSTGYQQPQMNAYGSSIVDYSSYNGAGGDIAGGAGNFTGF